MEKNIKLARAHRALSWFYGLFAIILLIIFLIPGKESPLLAIIFVLAFFCGLFALHHFTAKGARERKSWARNTSRCIAVLMLFGFPVGTIIGLYLLSNSWNVWESTNTKV